MMRYKRKSRYTPVSAIAQTRAMGVIHEDMGLSDYRMEIGRAKPWN